MFQKSWVVFILAVAEISCDAAQPQDKDSGPSTRSLLRVLVAPEKYSGALALLPGTLQLEAGSRALYLSSEARINFVKAHALYLQPKDCDFDWSEGTFLSSYGRLSLAELQHRFVELEGRIVVLEARSEYAAGFCPTGRVFPLDLGSPDLMRPLVPDLR